MKYPCNCLRMYPGYLPYHNCQYNDYLMFGQCGIFSCGPPFPCVPVEFVNPEPQKTTQRHVADKTIEKPMRIEQETPPHTCIRPFRSNQMATAHTASRTAKTLLLGSGYQCPSQDPIIKLPRDSKGRMLEQAHITPAGVGDQRPGHIKTQEGKIE